MTVSSRIGIDLEPADALAPDLWASICTPEEQAKLAVIRGMTPGLAARLVFCMKEAAFKCQYPLSGAMLEFADLAIDVDAEAGIFAAHFQKAAPPFRRSMIGLSDGLLSLAGISPVQSL